MRHHLLEPGVASAGMGKEGVWVFSGCRVKQELLSQGGERDEETGGRYRVNPRVTIPND